MKKSMKFATALAGAAVVVVGGTAFTASQTVPASQAGYGQGEITGVEIDKVAYEVGVTNKVTTAIFETDAPVDGLGFQATLYTGVAPGVKEESSTDCEVTGDGSPAVITCTMLDTTTVAEITFAGLAVWDEASA